jgi:NmrA-like family
MSLDIKLALNAEIVKASAGVVDEPACSSSSPIKSSYKKSSTTEWNVASETGTFQGEHWPSHLPRPPSRKKLLDDNSSHSSNGTTAANRANGSNAPCVVVFNANTHEGSSLVRVLSEKGLKVIAVVRVFTSRNTKQLIKLKNVVVKVADLNNAEAVYQAAVNCQQAFLVTKYWERFENAIEEQVAKVVLSASAMAGIQRLILATFEDTKELCLRNRKSQLVPTLDGRIFPKFTGMESIDHLGKTVGVNVTHMFTSFLDEDNGGKKSIILIRGENGKIILQEHNQAAKK